MGLSFQRSVKFGPLRFNFSGSGIGVSAGVPGFRVGTGPRGAYVSAGVGGFRYRQSMQAPQRRNAPQRPPAEPMRVEDSDVVSRERYEEPTALVFADSSGDTLLASMNAQAQKPGYAPWVWLPVGVVLLVAFKTLDGMAEALVMLGVLAVGALLWAWLRQRDTLRKLMVLFYELNDETEGAFEQLQIAGAAGAQVQKFRFVSESASYAERRRHAGAAHGLTFGPASFRVGQAPNVLANIEVPVLSTGKTTLGFYPDRVLVFSQGSVNAVSYSDLKLKSLHETFIEEDGVPADATVTGHTWKFVNNNGTPDRRFKDNRQIPECAYNRVTLQTPRGLNMRFSGSRSHGFDAFAEAVDKIGTVVSRAPRLRPTVADVPELPRFRVDPSSEEEVVLSPDGRRIANW